MATIELTHENFDDMIQNHDFVIVDFWADWCGPCKGFAPVYEKVSKDYPEIVFGKVNTEEQSELSSHFQVKSIPCLMIFREQVIIFNNSGALPEAQLRSRLDSARALDMEQIRQRLKDEKEE